MPIIKITSSVDMNDIQKAVRMTLEEVYSQYFFKGTHSSVTFDHGVREIVINSMSEDHVIRISKILKKNFSRLDLDKSLFTFEESTPASGGRFCRYISVKQGLTREESKLIIQYVKQLSEKARPRHRNGSVTVECPGMEDARELTQSLSSSIRDIPVNITTYADDQPQ